MKNKIDVLGILGRYFRVSRLTRVAHYPIEDRESLPKKTRLWRDKQIRIMIQLKKLN